MSRHPGPVRFLWVNAVNEYSEVETRYPNLGIGYLGASLESQFGKGAFQFKVVSSKVEETLGAFRPDVVGISAVSQNYGLARRYARLAAAREVPVLVGGVHITFLPNTLSPDMTVGCLGEGEDTVVDLMRVFLSRGRFPYEELRGIPGIVHRNPDSSLEMTEARRMRVDLGSIPFPDRDLLGVAPHTYMFTSRGCPYRCRFCASTRFWRNVRFFSAERVADEVELLVDRYHAQFISFFDDLFVANKPRFFEIVDLIERRGLVGRVKFSCSVRANTVTEDVAAGLKRLGVASVGMGLESGNPRVLEWLKGSGITVEHNRNAVRLLKKHGIMPNASFVIGSPDETEAEILDTLRFIKEIDLALLDVYILTPFPGTPVWEIARTMGLVSEDEDMDWSKLNVNFEVNPDKAIIMSTVLSREDIRRLYGKFRRYRLFHNFLKVWSHPMLVDLPRYGAKLLRERVVRLLRR